MKNGMHQEKCTFCEDNTIYIESTLIYVGIQFISSKKRKNYPKVTYMKTKTSATN